MDKCCPLDLSFYKILLKFISKIFFRVYLLFFQGPEIALWDTMEQSNYIFLVIEDHFGHLIQIVIWEKEELPHSRRTVSARWPSPN